VIKIFKNRIKLVLALLLIVVLLGIGTVSATGIHTTLDKTYKFKAMNVSSIDTIDVGNLSISKVEVLSTIGDNSDLKTINNPTFRYITRNFTSSSGTFEGITVTINGSQITTVDWTNQPAYNIYTQYVVPTIKMTVPGYTGNPFITKYNDSWIKSDTSSIETLLRGSQFAYMYKESAPGILHINVSNDMYTVYGGFTSDDYNKNNITYTLDRNKLSLTSFSADPANSRGLGFYSDTKPMKGKYFATAIYQNEPTANLSVYAVYPMIILDQNTTLQWNQSGTYLDTPPVYYQGQNGSVTLRFKSSNTDIASINSTTYLLINKSTTYDMIVDIDPSKLAVNAQNRWQTSFNPGTQISDLLYEAIRYDVGTPFNYTITAVGQSSPAPASSWSNISITSGYGISGYSGFANGNNNVTIPQSAMNSLNKGVYYVYLMGLNNVNDTIALDVKEVTVSGDAPVAGFSGTPTSGYAPLTVQFTDSSTGSPTTWSWTFGDGTTSTLQNPSKTYSSASTYTVALTATNAAGSSTETKTNYITVSSVPPTPAPVAAFTGSPTSGTAPLTVTFTDSSTNTPTSWSWDFGDGGTSTTQSPSHIYASNGTYTVSLTATNAGGSNTLPRSGYISVGSGVAVPVANFAGTPTAGTAPLLVTFTDSSTNTPTSWSWTFGDGTTSTVQSPSNTYSSVGTYTVSLTATNSAGSNTKTQTNYITVSAFGAPTVTSITPATGSNNGTVSIIDLAGTGFITGTTIKLTKSGQTDIAASTYTFVSSTKMTCTFDLTGKAVGQWNVVVTNPDTQTATLTNGFTITSGIMAPVANFAGTPTTGTAPLLVTFTDSSTGSPTSWSWTFGDGGTSTLQNPTHTYSVNGTYTVALTATNAVGSNTKTAANYITVGSGIAAPVANFVGTPTTGTAPLLVTFTDSSTGSPTSWSWTFGDDGTSPLQNPTHTYSVNGTYTVALTATNAAGSNTKTQTNYITVGSGIAAPVANFAGTPTTGNAPLLVTFTDSSTGSPTSWSWTFGDGSTSPLQNPTHTYSVNGTYTVALTATNAAGSNTKTAANYITVGSGIAAPVANFAGTPTTGNAPLLVTFTDSSTGSPTSWSWTFGDGGTSPLKNPTYTYSTAGNYTVSLTATNAGGSNTITRNNYIYVISTKPQADFTGTPSTGAAPLNVTFTDTSTRSPTSWSWNFGDGGTSTLQNPTHTYSTAGTYTVSLIATNAGGSDTITRNGYIFVYSSNPLPYFYGTPSTGASPLNVTFTDTTTGSPTSWIWDFGDGGTSTLQNPTHTYSTAGTYTVRLSVKNANGGWVTIIRFYYIYVYSSKPQAFFTGSPSSGASPLNVTFTDSTTGSPTSWYWDFGDGGTSTLQNPSHTYSATGTYTVSLTATNIGGSDTITRSGYVYVFSSEPLADFSGTPSTGAAPLAVQFTDRTTGSPATWNWDFGDGGTSTLQNPSHTYSASGTYSVTLTATNTGGSDNITRSSYINAFSSKPQAYFTFTPSFGTAPLPVTFTDTSIQSPTSWSWNFGDGGTSTSQNPTHTYSAAGAYTITLTATNSGGSDTTSRTLTVYETVPEYVTVAEFIPTQVTFGSPTIVIASGGTTNASCWYWDFGDGTTSTEPNPTHTYSVPGTYTITLITTSGTTCSSTATMVRNTETEESSSTMTMAVTVYALAPQSDFTATPLLGNAPLNVTFTDRSTNAPTGWRWTFGDGGTSTLQNPSHTYNSIGTYTISLTTTNTIGSDTITRNSYIMAYALAPQSDFTATPLLGNAPLNVTFTDTSTRFPTSWSWTFGDGGTSTLQNPTHIYNSTGTYNVSLTATNTIGSDTITRNSYIMAYALAPQSDFTATPLLGNAPLNVTFTDTSTRSPTSWSWTFGDGGTSTLQNPTHIYSSTGTYNVSLTATNAIGSDTITRNSYIMAYALAPQAYFTGTPTTGAAPLSVTFTDGSTNTPTSWSWNFGDGGTSIEKNPVHTYTSNGLYTVSLTATNAIGSNTKTVDNYITVTAVTGGDNVGVFRDGVFYRNGADPIVYGLPTDTPVIGDWNGDGMSDVGVFRDGVFYRKDATDIVYGLSTDTPVIGDWNGDGMSEVGVFRDGVFYRKDATDIVYGLSTDTPVIGDWNGDGMSEVGVFRDGVFYRNGATDIVYGLPTDTPVIGTWNADLTSEVGVFRDGVFYRNGATDIVYGLSTDTPIIGKWNTDLKFEVGVFRDGVFYRNGATDIVYGLPTDTPVIGDWNTDRISEVGVFRDGVFYRKDATDIVYGLSTDTPVIGDWNGDGMSEVGVFRDGVFYRKDATDIVYGLSTDTPVIGDWNGDGMSEVGVFRDGVFYRKDATDIVYGLPTDTPVIGDWNGDGMSEVGVFRDGVFYRKDATDIVYGLPTDTPLAGKWT